MSRRPRAPYALIPGRLAGLLVLLLAVLTGCSRSTTLPLAGPDRTPASLDQNAVSAIATLLQFEDRRLYDAEAFARILGSTAGPVGLEVRRRTAAAAGRIGDPAAVPVLLHLLTTDPAPAVRADAAFGLGLLGHDSSEVIDALAAAVATERLTEGEAHAAIAVEAIAALGRLGGERARNIVHGVLAAARPGIHAHRQVAGEALLAVWRFDDGAANVRAAAPYLRGEDPELRWRAAYALMRGGHPSALPHLLGLEDPDEHRTRAYTARALTAASADSADIADEARVWLVGALGDPHPHVRINAVRALAGYGDDVAIEPVAALLADPVAAVGVAAAGTLGAWGTRAAAPLASALQDRSLPVPLRGEILTRLAEVDPSTAAAAVREWATADDAERYFAARAAAVLPAHYGLEPARSLARDSVESVATAGSMAAAAHGDTLEVTLAERSVDPPPDPATAGLDVYEEIVRRYILPPLRGEPRPRARIATPHGFITLELMGDEAPLTVHNFVRLANQQYFDEGIWHRVIPNFVLQAGAPAGSADGGPGWSIRDEINRLRYDRGVLGMALSGPDTGGSQWFITHSPQPHLDGGYTIFGRVIEGQSAADAVLQGDPIPSIRMLP